MSQSHNPTIDTGGSQAKGESHATASTTTQAVGSVTEPQITANTPAISAASDISLNIGVITAPSFSNVDINQPGTYDVVTGIISNANATIPTGTNYIASNANTTATVTSTMDSTAVTNAQNNAAAITNPPSTSTPSNLLSVAISETGTRDAPSGVLEDPTNTTNVPTSDVLDQKSLKRPPGPCLSFHFENVASSVPVGGSSKKKRKHIQRVLNDGGGFSFGRLRKKTSSR